MWKNSKQYSVKKQHSCQSARWCFYGTKGIGLIKQLQPQTHISSYLWVLRVLQDGRLKEKNSIWQISFPGLPQPLLKCIRPVFIWIVCVEVISLKQKMLKALKPDIVKWILNHFFSKKKEKRRNAWALRHGLLWWTFSWGDTVEGIWACSFSVSQFLRASSSHSACILSQNSVSDWKIHLYKEELSMNFTDLFNQIPCSQRSE